ncbi:MAG: hypothetical protein ACYC3P_02890 [Bellilinea sp.]
MKSYWVGIILFIFIAGCSPKGSTGGNSATKQDVKAIFDIPADPIAVTITTDADRQAEKLIPAEGGSLSVTASDGSAFTLDIPAGALVVETVIRMTPVKAITGLPFGDGTAYTVQLEPEGLQLFADATLTITPAAEIPIDNQLFFGYQGQGTDLILAAPVVESSEIKILVSHFSGYGVTKGLLADIEPVRQRLGGSAEARLNSQIAEQLALERQRQLLGSGEEGMNVDFEAYFKEFEEQVVKPRIAAAGESCAAGQLALQTVLGHERQKQLLGSGDSEAGSPFDVDLLDTVTNVCMKEEYEMCRDDHVIQRIIPVWLGTERQYQLLGFAEGSAALENARNYVRKCLRFELEFHSEGVFDDGGGGGYDSTVESKTVLQFNPQDFSMKGKSALINTAFDFRVTGCAVTSNRGGGDFEVLDLAIVPGETSTANPLGSVKDFNMLYFPGNTSEFASITCEDQPTYTMPPSPLWAGIFLPLHESELNFEKGGFEASGWEILGGEYFAKKEWTKNDASIDITEVGTFKLYHRPE